MRRLLLPFLLLFISCVVYAQQSNLETISISSNTTLVSYKQKVFFSLTSNAKCISPNNTCGLPEKLVFHFNILNESIKPKQWSLQIFDNNSKEIFISSGTNLPVNDICWDANYNGRILEGNFKYLFKIIINKKEEISIEQSNIIVDMTLPCIALQTSMDTIVISEGDLLKTVTITPTAEDENGIDFEKTELKIINKKNKIVRSWKLKNMPQQNIVWNGKDDIYDEFVKPGDYKIVLTVYDLLGNYNEIKKNITVLRCDVKGDISDIVVKEKSIGLLVNLTNVIFFNSGSCTITKKAIPILQQIVNILKVYQANKVLIEGYTDNVETKEPLTLSYIRAQAVYAYLVKNNIQAERLQAVGYGKEKPIASNNNSNARMQNRRVNIIILKNEESSNEKQNNNDENIKIVNIEKKEQSDKNN